MKYISYIILTLLLLLSGCTSTEASKDKNDRHIPNEPGINWFKDMQKEFEKRNNEFKSYWNDFPFNDALLVASKQTEEKFATFLFGLYKIGAFGHRFVDSDNAFMQEHINILMEKVTAGGVNDRFLALAEKYLYEPNSPYYNDEVYLCFLKYEAKTDFRHLSQSARFKRHYNMIQKNMVGEPATDFTYETQTGQKVFLYEIDAKYLVLFFNDPSCSECKKVKDELLQQQSALDSLDIKVFAVYIDDKPEEWRQANYPAGWLNGYAPEIDSQDLYNIRALPCLYLLDKDKKVVHRDTSVELIVQFFYRKVF